MTDQTLARSPLDDVRTGTDAVMCLDPADLSDGELASTILRFRQQLDRQEAVFADLIVAGHRRGVGAEDGYESTPAWLRARSGMRTGEVHPAIAAGELGEVLPATRAAWRAGKVLSGAVRVMRSARVPGFDDELAAVEPELLAAAVRKDFWSLGRMASYFKRCARRDGGLHRNGMVCGRRSSATGWLSMVISAG